MTDRSALPYGLPARPNMLRGLRRRAGVPWPGAAHRRKTRTRWWSHALYSQARARRLQPHGCGLYKPPERTAPQSVQIGHAAAGGSLLRRTRAAGPALVRGSLLRRTRNRRGGQATMAGRRWRRRRHRTCAPTRPMARPPLGTQKTHSTPSSVTTVSSTGSFRRVATNAPRAARVGYLSQARAGHRPSRSSQPPSYMEPSAYTRRPCPSATREEALVHVAAPRRQSAVPAQSVLHPQAR
jgi:hypothetical protein